MKKSVAFIAFWTLVFFQTAVSNQQEFIGTLLISEVGYDVPGDDSRSEWFELVNAGTESLRLDDIFVGDEERKGGSEGMVGFPEGTFIEPGQTLVISQTAVGFQALFGFAPDFEVVDSVTAVPDLEPALSWASGSIGLGNDGDELLILHGVTIIDAINYEERTTFFSPSIGPALTGQSIERVPANCDTNSASDWQTAVLPTPGQIIFADSCPPPGNMAPAVDALMPIGEIQGTSEQSPLLNQVVTFRGVMTGWHADTNASGVTFYTLFVQDLPGFEDGDPDSSDAVPVFIGRERPLAQIGDSLRVTGQVTEFFGLTEIDDDNLQLFVESSGNPLPPPIPLDEVNLDALESLEGMLVSLSQPGVVMGPTFSGCGASVVWPQIGLDRIFERGDEDAVVQRPFPILHHDETQCAAFPQLKTGDEVEGLYGPLTYHFDEFKLVQQAENELFVEAGPLPPLPQISHPEDPAITIATFNMFNHFDAVDDTGDDAEPKPDPGEIEIKAQKIRYAIAELLNCPTVIGVQEVEKADLLVSLVVQLEPLCGFGYEITHFESADVRGIDLALLTDPNKVVVQQAELLQHCTAVFTEVVDSSIVCPAGENPLFSRPPLRVEVLIFEQPYTFIVNHFKSKRGGAEETAVRRLAQARFVNGFVGALLEQNQEANIVVMGDFNDFEASPTMMSLTADGRLTNSLLAIPDDLRYSFVFAGVSQLIDGILLSPNLTEKVDSVDILHVNADFPFGWGNDLATYLPYRSSDHDLPHLSLDLSESTVESTATRPVAPTPTPTLTAPTPVIPTATPMPPQPAGPGSNLSILFWVLGLALIGGGGVYWFRRRGDQ